MSSQEPRELTFEFYGRTLAAQEWGMPGGKPVLALHGWLDNSASFSLLAPQLNAHVVALDLAGHGKSSYREAGSPYNIWQDVAEVFAVADQLGWQEFSLLGHSRGAMIAVMAAGTFPERITDLALIDGLRPGVVKSANAPQQLAKSIVDTFRVNGRGYALYPDREMAVHMRLKAEIPITMEMAEILATRGVRQEGDGFVWCSDPQLKIASALKLSDEQADAFFNNIKAPISLIIAQDGLPRIREFIEAAVKRYPQVETFTLPGGHHLHLEKDNVDEVANVLNNIFSS